MRIISRLQQFVEVQLLMTVYHIWYTDNYYPAILAYMCFPDYSTQLAMLGIHVHLFL